MLVTAQRLVLRYVRAAPGRAVQNPGMTDKHRALLEHALRAVQVSEAERAKLVWLAEFDARSTNFR